MGKKQTTNNLPTKKGTLRRAKSVKPRKLSGIVQRQKRMEQLYTAGIRAGRLKAAGYIAGGRSKPDEHKSALVHSKKVKNPKSK